MTIDWQHFTPYSALAGGAIIGGAVALLLLFNGRIAGISGITGGVLSAGGQERAGAPHLLAGCCSLPGCMLPLRLCLLVRSRSATVGWRPQGCWWDWALDWAAVAPAGTACAASHGWRRVRWPPRRCLCCWAL